MEVKTVIGELTKMIDTSCKALSTYRYRVGLFDSEDMMYEVLENEVRDKIRKELVEAKKVMATKKRFWDKIKIRLNGN